MPPPPGGLAAPPAAVPAPAQPAPAPSDPFGMMGGPAQAPAPAPAAFSMPAPPAVASGPAPVAGGWDAFGSGARSRSRSSSTPAPAPAHSSSRPRYWWMGCIRNRSARAVPLQHPPRKVACSVVCLSLLRPCGGCPGAASSGIKAATRKMIEMISLATGAWVPQRHGWTRRDGFQA